MGTQNGLDHPLSQFSPKSSELAHTASRGGSPSLGVPEDSPYRTSSDGPDYQDERYGGPSYKEGDRVLYKAQYDKPQLGSVRDIVRWPSGRFHGYLVMLDGNNAVTAQDHQLEPENGQAEAFFNHPDPWMDNEPGTTTFPQQWNHLGATKVAWETEPEMSDWDEEIPLNFHDPEQPIDSIESTPGEYYHVAPAEERARIMTHGLLPSKTWQDNYADEVEPRGQAQGIYMWDHPEAAQRWANSQQKAADIWRVTLPPNHPVARDQILGTIGAHYTPSAVPPQQLEWMGPSETAMKGVPEGHPWGNPKPNWRDPNDDWPMDDLRVWRPQETLSQPPYNIGQGIPKRLPLKPSKLSMERGVFYHVAPRSVREQILTEGLRGHEPDVESPWEDNDTAWGGQNPTWRDRQPRGNYFFDHPDQAKGYIARLHGKSPEFSFEESGLEPDPDDYGSLEDYEHAYDEYAAKPITDNDVHQLAPEHQGWDIWKTHLDPDRQRILSDPENSLVAEHYDNEQTANPSTWEALHEFRQQSQEGDYDPDIMRWYTPDHVSPDQLQHYSWTPHWGVSHDPEEWGDYNQTEVPDQFTRIPMQRYFGKLARPVPDDYWYDQTEKRPYVYHATDPYNLPSIFEHGVVPWDHQGVEPGTNYTDQFVPRPGHVYLSQHPQIAYDLADSSMAGKGSNRHPVVLKIRRGQLDPQNINPDEDDLASQYHEFEDLLADNKLPADHSLQNGGWSRGTAAEAIGFGSDPRDSQRYLNNSATFAHRGPIPPQAIESVLQGPPMPGVGFGLHESQPYGFGYTSAVSPQLWQLAVEALWGGNSLATAQDAQRAAWGLWERGMGMGLPVSLEDAQNALKLAEMAMHHSVGQGGRPYEDDTAAWHPGEDLQEAIAGEPPTWLNEAPTGRELPGPQRFGTTEGAALAPQGSPLLRASSIA